MLKFSAAFRNSTECTERMRWCRQRVREVRAQEAKVMRTMATYQGFFGLTLFIGPVMVSIASFAAYAGAPLRSLLLH